MKRNVIVTQHYTSTIVDIKWWLFGNISLIYCFFFVPDKILPRLLYWGNSITDRRSIRKDKNAVLFVLSVRFSNNIASSTSDMFLWACMFCRMVYVRKCFIVDTGHHFINTVQLSNETYIVTCGMWPAKNTCRVNCRLKAPLLVIYNTPQSPVNKIIHAIITPPPSLGVSPPANALKNEFSNIRFHSVVFFQKFQPSRFNVLPPALPIFIRFSRFIMKLRKQGEKLLVYVCIYQLYLKKVTLTRKLTKLRPSLWNNYN